MPKTDLTQYDKDPANNTDVDGVDIAEGCAPSGINNAIRSVMSHIAEMNDGTVALTSPDINGGTIDGVTIGGTTAGAGTFTTGQFNTSLNVDGTVTANGLTVDGSVAVNANSLALTGTSPVITITDSDTGVDHTLSGASGVGNLTLSVDANNEGTSPNLVINVGGSQALRVSDGGDIAFYDSTGVSQDFTWDASQSSINVNGTVTADGLTIDGGNTLRLNASSTTDFFTIIQGGTQAVLTADSDGAANMLFKTASAGVDTDRMQILSNGDIAFYDSTGVSQDFLWDASASSLNVNGDVSVTGTLPLIKLTDTDNSSSRVEMDYNFGYFQIDVDANQVDAAEAFRVAIGGTKHFEVSTGGDIAFYEDTGTTAKFFWDASAERLGIGTVSPQAITEIVGSNSGGALDVLNLRNAGGDGSEVTINMISSTDQTNTAARSFIKSIRSGSNPHLTFGTANTERMRIDSSGNVGIGTSGAPSFTFGGGLEVQKAGISTVRIDNSSSSVAAEFSAYDPTFGALLYTTTNHPISFGTSGGLRVRIDTGGNVLVGKTSDDNTANGITIRPDGAGRFTTAGTSSFTQLAFFRNGSAAEVGSITTTSTATAYNTSSDYRLKEDWQPMTGAIERVNALNPVNFAWQADGSRVDGFLAHEAQEVVPEAVTGERDAMREEEYEVTPAVLDEDGNVVTEAVMGTRQVPDYQGIDQSKLVPLLTAALQEAIAKIETLEEKVAALENA